MGFSLKEEEQSRAPSPTFKDVAKRQLSTSEEEGPHQERNHAGSLI